MSKSTKDTKKYQILSWDGVIVGNDLPRASVLISPDLHFLEVVKMNKNNLLQIKISGTNSRYDNVWICQFDKSANIPNCRPNFYQEYGLYILTLVGCSWQGEPSCYGEVEILNGPYINYSRTCPSATGVPTGANPSTLSTVGRELVETGLSPENEEKEKENNPMKELTTRQKDREIISQKIKQTETKGNKKNILVFISIGLIILSLLFILFYMFNKPNKDKFKFNFVF